MAFRISGEPILPQAFLGAHPDVGAWVTFEGRVRNTNEGRAVRALDYEAYGPLAEKEGARILAEALQKFKVSKAECVHRTGSLALGDLAVWVAVGSGHRAEAFEACRYIIDQVKARVPIWKREHYLDGCSEWINAAAPA